MITEGIMMALQPSCLLLMVVGVTVGIVFGAIPGLSAQMAIVLFLPLSFALDTVNAICLLVALYVGGISGGLISAILLNIPGTSSSVPTLYDGHPMAMKGQAGKALGIGILYSFIGTFVGCLALMFAAPSLAKVCLKFTAPDYLGVAIFSMTIITTLAGKSIVKGLISGMLGWALCMVGLSPVGGVQRYTMGHYELLSGFSLIPILIGFYAVSELYVAAFNRKSLADNKKKYEYKIKGYGITLKEFLAQTKNMIFACVVGTTVGILPGLGGGSAGNMTYALAKTTSKYPEKFGTGIIDGVVASECSNNATIGGGMIPMLVMGIPGTPTAAILMSGLMIHGISTGPLIFSKNGAAMYGIMTGLLISSILMLIIERVFLPGFVRVLDIPKHILMPCVVVICTVGAYAANGRIFDVWCVLFFSLIVMIMKYFKLPSAPFIIALNLGGSVEVNINRTLSVFGDDLNIILHKPIAMSFILLSLITFAVVIRSHSKKSADMVRDLDDEGDDGKQ